MPDAQARNPRRMSAIRLRNFRSVGDPGVELRLGKRLTMMYGENGAGKSTLCRALKLFSSLPELMADVDKNDCHQFNTNLAIEFEASFEGRGHPLLDVTWVEAPIARVNFQRRGRIRCPHHLSVRTPVRRLQK